MPPKTPVCATSAPTMNQPSKGRSPSGNPALSSIGIAPNAEEDPTMSDDIHGSTGSSSPRVKTCAPTSAPPCSTSAPEDASSAMSNVRRWLLQNGLPLELLETRAMARGIDLDTQLKGMLQYCLDNGVNGD